MNKIHPLLLEGGSLEAKANRLIWKERHNFHNSGTFVALLVDRSEQYFRVRWTDKLFSVKVSRPFMVTEFTVNGSCWLQPFYESSGSNNPNRSPEGTWWPYSAVYTEEYVEVGGGKQSWIGKHFWSQTLRKWIPHFKRREKLPILLRCFIQEAL